MVAGEKKGKEKRRKITKKNVEKGVKYVFHCRNYLPSANHCIVLVIFFLIILRGMFNVFDLF